MLDELAECIASQEQTDQVLDRMALRDALERFLKTLSKQHADIFMRRYFSMIPVSEIAAELGLKENTVKSILRRSREKLHTQLKEEELL